MSDRTATVGDQLDGVSRREFLRFGSAGTAAVVLGGGGLFLAACDPVGLGGPDANGLLVPPYFTSRVIATTGQPVAGTGYVWHTAPDGGDCFPLPDGGWSYVSNAEWVPGGASYVRFASDGTITDAGRCLDGATSFINCAGGAMPWGTWLSCEELPAGRVFECDPIGATPAVVRPAMGLFTHEAAAADTVNQVIYLTEDKSDGALYRFVPDTWGDLSSGTLEVLTEVNGVLSWHAVPDPAATSTETRYQVADTKRFKGGEGCDVFGTFLYFTTKGDNRVWKYDTVGNTLQVIYDPNVHTTGELTGVDNLVTSDAGVVYVAEDGGNMQIVLVREDGSTFPVVEVPGVAGSEITGPAFDPSGNRLYFSSQRNPGRTYEVTGPWAAFTEPGPFNP